jgi:DNA invertase Pin-like site-specific DNA recombinase
MRIGYARVSTAEQNLNLQLDALKKAKCKRIYEEHGSGKDSARLELLSCLKALRADDVLVVWRLDRLGRSLSELVRIAGQLAHRKIGLESLHSWSLGTSPAQHGSKLENKSAQFVSPGTKAHERF